MPLQPARDVDLTNRVGDCSGLGCVRIRGPSHLKSSAVRRVRALAADPALSGVTLADESRRKKGSPSAILPFCRCGVRVVLASNSSSSSSRESEDTSCMPCLPCSSYSISCSLGRALLVTRWVQVNDAQEAKASCFTVGCRDKSSCKVSNLENEFQFQEIESYASLRKTSRGNLIKAL